MKKVTIPEYHALLKAQEVSAREHIAGKCPMCGTVQSFRSLIKAGAGKTEDEVEKFHSFSCVGRFTRAGTPRKKPDGKPCNWTLGGFLRLHKLEVVDNAGVAHPRFEPATREEAQALEASWAPAAVETIAEAD